LYESIRHKKKNKGRNFIKSELKNDY